MIKSVSIQNFEAHQDTTIQFGPGLNLICGLSNSGKSSILRAIRVAVNNDWDKEMVRSGCEFCRVRVETERGWVEAERGEKVNRWRCQENGGEVENFRNVGIRVPDMATRILGMCERDRGGGIRELPNFQTQLERHYMLSEIGEKKATSNMIAVMMDNAIGLGGIEGLIKDFSSDLLSDRNWLTRKQSEINDAKSSMIDDAVFSSYERAMDQIDRCEEDLAGMEDDLARAEAVFADHERRRLAAERAAAVASAAPETDGLFSRMERVSLAGAMLAVAEPASRKERSLSLAKACAAVELDGLAGMLGKCARLGGTLGGLERARAASGRLAATGAVAAIDADGLSGKLAGLSDGAARIRQAEKALHDSRELWRRWKASSDEAARISAELKSLEDEFGELRRSLGVCPLCGAKMD